MNFKLYVYSIILFLVSFQIHAQEDSISVKKETYVKGNGATLLLAVPHIGIETTVGKKFSYQFDVMASFWNSIDGLPYKFGIATSELRYHFKKRFQGIYAGAHVAGTTFKIAKNFRVRDFEYQQGLGYMVGSTIGFQKKLKGKWMIDVFIGGGWHQGFYKGYHIDTGERLEGATKYNKSGEWLPYRGGVMLAYKIN